MNELLRFLITHLSFLYEDHGFRFVDSDYTNTSFGNAYFTLSNGRMRIRIVLDRSQMFCEFQQVRKVGRQSTIWHDIGVVRGLMEGSPQKCVLFDAHWAEFLRKSVDEIEFLLLPENLAAAKRRMGQPKSGRRGSQCNL